MEGCIIGPYFFENDIERAVTVNGQRYHDMFDNFCLPQVEAMVVTDIHYEGEHDLPAWSISRETDFKVWRC